MYTIKGDPTLTAKGHEMLARLYEDHAYDAAMEAGAAATDDARRCWEELEVQAEGTSKGHRFRAEELRYDARGGMTEAQARAASEARAAACGELVELIHGALAAGVKPATSSRDDVAEMQGETWDVVADEIPGTPETAEIVAEVFRRADARSRLLGVLETRTVVTTIPPGWTRDEEQGGGHAADVNVVASGGRFPHVIDPRITARGHEPWGDEIATTCRRCGAGYYVMLDAHCAVRRRAIGQSKGPR